MSKNKLLSQFIPSALQAPTPVLVILAALQIFAPLTHSKNHHKLQTSKPIYSMPYKNGLPVGAAVLQHPQ